MRGRAVSVILTVYNDEKYISECVGSILAQTLDDYEFIIVDDGSTDRTHEILEKYAKDNTHIKLVRNEKNMGIAYSGNKGFKLATGEYLSFMGSDDRSLPNRLEKQYDFLSCDDEFGGCGTFLRYIDDDGKVLDIKEPPLRDGVITDILGDPSQIAHGTCMIRREVYEKCGGYREEFERGVDYDFLLRISEKFKLINIPKVLYEVRFSIDRGTVRHRDKQLYYCELANQLAFERRRTGTDCLQRHDMNAFRELKDKIIVKQSPDRVRSSSNYLYWAKRMYHRGPIGYARMMIIQAIKHNPLNMNAWIYFLFLFMNDNLRTMVYKLKGRR